MAAYYTAQEYDAPAALIWSVLTDFDSWPRWFPNISRIDVENADAGGAAGTRARLVAAGANKDDWARWEIVEWQPPSRLVCEHLESTAPFVGQVQAAYLQFEVIDEPEGCRLEVEIGAEGYGLVGDFFVGVTLGSEVRKLLPQLIDAFTAHVVAEVAAR
jgi:uncharacterized protein YndB with AHSA1/START domain